MMLNDKVTNLNYLRELAKGDAGFIKEMIAIFLAENPEELRQLEYAIQAHDFEKIKSVSHHMKSTIPFVGLDLIIGNDLRNIEGWAIENVQLDAIKINFTRVKQVCEKAFDELKEA